MAAFQVFDLEVSRRVFSVCGTSTRVFALDEQLGAWGAGEPFIYMVESPYEDFDDDFTRLRACEITLDRGRSTAPGVSAASRSARPTAPSSPNAVITGTALSLGRE
jgi:hypothetical protein